MFLLSGATGLFGLAIANRHELNPWLTNLAAGLFSISLALVVLRSQWRDLFEFDGAHLIGAALLGGAMVACTHVGYWFVTSHVAPGVEQTVVRLYGDIQKTAPPMPLMILLIALIVAAEEIVWRGVTFELLESHMTMGAIVVVSTLLYALPQLIGGSWVLIAAALAVGLVFGILRARTGRLGESILTHAIWSISIFGVIPLESH